MKKLLTLSIALVLSLTLVGCGNNQTTQGGKGPEGSLEEILDKIYETKKPEFMIGSIPVDLTDELSTKSFTGLDNTDLIDEALASESMMGSQAYSLVLARVKDASKMNEVANAMKDGIDQRKWICVEADNLRVVGAGDVVMLIMVSTELSDTITVDQIVDSFTTLCGGSLSVDLK